MGYKNAISARQAPESAVVTPKAHRWVATPTTQLLVRRRQLWVTTCLLGNGRWRPTRPRCQDDVTIASGGRVAGLARAEPSANQVNFTD